MVAKLWPVGPIRPTNQFNQTRQIFCKSFSSATFPTADSSTTALTAACHVNHAVSGPPVARQSRIRLSAKVFGHPCRGITKLNVPGARSKFGAPMFEPEVLRKQMYYVEESTCDNVGTCRCPSQSFGTPTVIWRPGNCDPSLHCSTPDLHELDRQSQPSQGGCHIYELQDQPLTFSDNMVLLAFSQQGLQHALGQFSTACDQARMKISTKLPRYFVFLQTKGSVCCKWAEYIAAGREIQVHSGGIYEWRKEERWGQQNYLVWSQQNYRKLLLSMRNSKYSSGCRRRDPP